MHRSERDDRRAAHYEIQQGLLAEKAPCVLKRLLQMGDESATSKDEALYDWH